MSSLNLLKLRKTKLSDNLYKKLITGKELSEEDAEALLQIAAVLLRADDELIKQLGYRIIVLFAKNYNTTLPLFDVSLNLGYFPVVDLLISKEQQMFQKDTFFGEFQSAYLKNYRLKEYTASFEQLVLKKSFVPEAKSHAVVAPTSYGKSELIEMAGEINGNVCIIVPTKALLAQTKKRLLGAGVDHSKLIVTHPDMKLPVHKKNIISVVTQERAIRLMQLHRDLIYDVLYVDEAHNLLEDDSRSRLLAAAILMTKKRNDKVNISYLTPFLKDVDNLKIKDSETNKKEIRIKEKIKSESIYFYDFRKTKELKIYDQYLNEFYDIKSKKFKVYSDFLEEYAGYKNIVYLNKPLNAQEYAKEIASYLPKIKSQKIAKCIKSIKEVTHKEYDLLYCLERGVVYHHGSMQDSIKLFVENIYTDLEEVKYIVTTSTLLEGVNIPAEKLFVLDNRKGIRALSPSQFKNLIGRVCRFSEIFNPSNGSVKFLSPEIYVLGTHYCRSNANIKKFVQDTMKVDKKNDDKVENILLENSKETDEKKFEREDFGRFINNVEEGIVKEVDVKQPDTAFGKNCFENNLFEIDILQSEHECLVDIENYKRKGKVSNPDDIMQIIYDVFIKHLKPGKSENITSLKRLENLGTRNFYSMLLNWRINNTKMYQMIWSFLEYWDELVRTEEDPWVYVGRWGEDARDGFLPRWVNISKKDQNQRINLAIVRIKDEQDFVDNSIMKFIEVLNEQELLDGDTYKLIKYGTTDDKKINLAKNGISLGLISLVMEKYPSFLIEELGCQTYLKKSILDEMNSDNVNDVLLYEAKFHVR